MPQIYRSDDHDNDSPQICRSGRTSQSRPLQNRSGERGSYSADILLFEGEATTPGVVHRSRDGRDRFGGTGQVALAPQFTNQSARSRCSQGFRKSREDAFQALQDQSAVDPILNQRIAECVFLSADYLLVQDCTNH